MLPIAIATVFGPGLLVLLALGVRQGVVLLGATPAASIGVAVLVASGCALLGVRFSATALVAGTILLAVLAESARLASWWGRGMLGLRGPFAEARPPTPATTGTPLLPGLPRLTGLVARLTGAVFVVTGAGLALRTWGSGIGRWTTWNQDHDPILHAVLTAYIQYSGRGAPWQIMPADVMVGTPTVYYPGGFHLMAAAIGGVFGDPVIGMNAAAATLLGAAWTASAAALDAVGVHWLRGGPAWMALGAGIGSVVAAGLYRPGAQLARDNGLLPNATALVLVPGVVAAILMLRRRDWGASVGVAVACVGIVAVHPSAGLSVGLTMVAMWLALLCTRDGRAGLRAQWPMLALTVGLAGVLGAPVLAGALAVGGRITAFPPDVSGIPVTQSLGAVVPLVYGGMFDAKPITQAWPTLLLLAGVVTALVVRRAVPLVVTWGMWVTVVLLAYRNPRGLTAPILGFFYNSAARVQSHVALFAPALATVGAFGVLLAVLAGLRALRPLRPLQRLAAASRARLAGMPRSTSSRPPWEPRPVKPVKPTRPVWPASGWAGAFGVALLALGTVAYLAGPTPRYLQTTAEALSQRWSHPQFTRLDGDDLAAAAWLAPRVEPGQRIMNNANDGSTYLYVHDALPVVELSTLGVPGFPYTWQLLKRFRYLEFDPRVRQLIVAMNIAWVYVDSRAPYIGAEGAPDNWTGGGVISTAPGLGHLDDVPGLTLAHISGTVSIYKVDLAEIRGIPAEP